MLGTTQCTNAIVERKHLEKIAIIRIGAPPPPVFPLWWTGQQTFSKLLQTLSSSAEDMSTTEKKSLPWTKKPPRLPGAGERKSPFLAISCVFSTIREDHERRIAALCREVLGEDIHTSISCEIGSMGLIERENATILNAALYQVAERFTDGFARSLADEGVTNAEIYLSQNDGHPNDYGARP